MACPKPRDDFEGFQSYRGLSGLHKNSYQACAETKRHRMKDEEVRVRKKRGLQGDWNVNCQRGSFIIVCRVCSSLFHWPAGRTGELACHFAGPPASSLVHISGFPVNIIISIMTLCNLKQY